MEVNDEGVCWIDWAYFAEGMVVGECWVESSSCVQGDEFRVKDVVGLLEAVACTDDLGGLAGMGRVWQVFGKGGE